MTQPEADSASGLPALADEIGDEELIVRAVKSPYHVNKAKTRLLHKAFHPHLPSILLSVIRLETGADYCADKGRESVTQLAASRPGTKSAQYEGLAVGRARKVRTIGVGVEDAPEDFYGHAHMVYEPLVPLLESVKPEEAMPPELTEALHELAKRLLEEFQFYPDPEPAGSGWTGEPLLAPEEPAAENRAHNLPTLPYNPL